MKRLSRVLLKMLATSAVFTLLFASAAVAQEVVKDQENTMPAVDDGLINQNYAEAQSITTATGGYLDSYSLYLTRSGSSSSGSLCGELWTEENGLPQEFQEDVGCVEPADVPLHPNYGWVEFNSTSTTYMEPGTKYVIVLRSATLPQWTYHWSLSQGYSTNADGSCNGPDYYTGGTSLWMDTSAWSSREWKTRKCQDHLFVTHNIVDSTAPTGTILLNNGATRTTTRLVILNVDATDPEPSSGVTQMRFKNAGTDTVWSAWQPYKSSRSWYLTPGEGTKRVAAQFRDAAGNRSTPVYDYIIFRR